MSIEPSVASDAAALAQARAWVEAAQHVMVLTGAAWLYGVLQTSRRRQTRDPDAKTMMHAAGSGANAIASGLTIVMFWASGYFFLFYKAQTDVYTMVPLGEKSSSTLLSQSLSRLSQNPSSWSASTVTRSPS